MKVRQIAALLVAVSLGTGCFSKTRIYSKPSGAAVVLDHKKSLGNTPVELDEQVWIWTKHAVTLQADGYETQTIQLRSSGVNFGYLVICACTLGVLLPIALLSEYPKQFVVQMSPAAPQSDAEPISEQAKLSFP